MTMGENSEIKEWIEALNKLREQPDSNIACPKCKTGKLKIIIAQTDDRKRIDEYVVCSNCNTTFSVTSSLK